MIVVTAATGHLGRLVLDALVARGVAPGSIVAAVRSPEKASDLAAKGFVVRQADYHKPETLTAALKDADQLLLISSSDFNDRAGQHRNVVAAAKAAGVKLIAYTSIPDAETSPILLAADHKATEEAIRAAGLPFVFLRNGWYAENYAGAIAGGAATGKIHGSAGTGRISAAPRADYAAAAAAVLTGAVPAGTILELGGDDGFTLAELAEAVGKAAGRSVDYVNLAEAGYAEALKGVGLPEPVAQVFAQADASAADGWLHVTSGDLSRVIGRPTTPIFATIRASLAQPAPAH